METANENGQEISSVCVCFCACVSVHVCPHLPVNRTLIALALQLVDFHSKENFGINKDEHIQSLEVCYLWISIGKIHISMTEKKESEGKREEMASAYRRDQAGWMWLFTLKM